MIGFRGGKTPEVFNRAEINKDGYDSGILKWIMRTTKLKKVG